MTGSAWTRWTFEGSKTALLFSLEDFTLSLHVLLLLWFGCSLSLHVLFLLCFGSALFRFFLLRLYFVFADFAFALLEALRSTLSLSLHVLFLLCFGSALFLHVLFFFASYVFFLTDSSCVSFF